MASSRVLVAAAMVATSSATAVTPLQKVLTMMDDMLAKGKAEKQKEETEFASFHQWCDSTRDSTTKSIADGASAIEQLTADIAKAEADAEQLGSEAEDELASADADQAELDKAQSIRDKEHADYSATHADQSESIDAIERAIAALKSREADVPQSLLQLRDSVQLPAEARASIESLLALGQAPEANAYEFQGGGVVKMLEDLRLKFQDERLALEKEELAAKSEFEVIKQRLTGAISEAKKTAAEKTATKAQRLEDAATAKGDLSVTKTTKAEDEKTLTDTNDDCDARSREFEKNQVVRAEEVKAIETAKGILSSDDVSGNADKHLPAAALIQARGVSLAQLRGEVSAPRQHAIEFLQGRARELGSRYLALAASSAASDPFAKVKKMVKDLIVKLMEEANAEADHNSYCTTELSTNKMTRDNKQAEVEELTANVEKHTSESSQLKTQIAELTDSVAELKGKQSEATQLRNEEKKTNTQAIEDAKVAQVAVSKATQVLKDFYAKNAASAFVQDSSDAQLDDAMKAPYKGMQAGSGGIVGMLEVILSDFARLETETSSAESQAQSSFDTFMDEANQDVAVKETEIAHKENGKEECDADNRSLKKELELTQEELNAAMDYYDKLKPDCVDNGLSYEDRVQKREEEIQALGEALKILNQESV